MVIAIMMILNNFHALHAIMINMPPLSLPESCWNIPGQHLHKSALP
jgi:hypothetical protein